MLILLCLRTSKISTSALYLFYRTAAITPSHHHAIVPSSTARYYATTLSRLRIITPSRLQVLHATTPLPFLASTSSRHRVSKCCTLLRHYPSTPSHQHAIASTRHRAFKYCTLLRHYPFTPSHDQAPFTYHAPPTGTHRRIYRGKVTKKYLQRETPSR